jgi:hypothetical protein
MVNIFDEIDLIDKSDNYDNTIFTLINLLTLIVGLVIGLILGYLVFKKISYKGPDSNIIVNEIYTESNGKKYKWVPKVCICPISYSMDKLKDPNYVDSEH